MQAGDVVIIEECDMMREHTAILVEPYLNWVGDRGRWWRTIDEIDGARVEPESLMRLIEPEGDTQ